MLDCFSCFRKKEEKTFIQAVRDGNHSVAQTTLHDNPGLAKSVTLVDKKNALHLAAEEGHLVVMIAVLEILTCQESVRNTENGDGDESESIQRILNAQDARGQTPLFMASALGHTDCVRLLLTNGADRNVADLRGNLPLHMAAWWGHLSIVFMLLDFSLPEGHDEAATARAVNCGNITGLTPLHLAVWGRRSGIMQILLQHNADINLKSGNTPQPDVLLPCPSGSTPLHLAAARGSVEICKLLLKTHYERVVEPLLLESGSAAAAAAASLATPDDPRMQVNDLMQMPYQIAQRLGFAPLAMLLRPTISLSRLFGEIDRHTPRIYGAPSLKSIATEAVNRKLAADLEALMNEMKDLSLNATPLLENSDLHSSSKHVRRKSRSKSAKDRRRSKRRPPPSELVISADVEGGGLEGIRSPSASMIRSPLSPIAPITPEAVLSPGAENSRPSSRLQGRRLSFGVSAHTNLGLRGSGGGGGLDVLPGLVAEEQTGADAETQLLQQQMEELMQLSSPQGVDTSSAADADATTSLSGQAVAATASATASATEGAGRTRASRQTSGVVVLSGVPEVEVVRVPGEANVYILSPRTPNTNSAARPTSSPSVLEIRGEDQEMAEEEEGGSSWGHKVVVGGGGSSRPSSTQPTTVLRRVDDDTEDNAVANAQLPGAQEEIGQQKDVISGTSDGSLGPLDDLDQIERRLGLAGEIDEQPCGSTGGGAQDCERNDAAGMQAGDVEEHGILPATICDLLALADSSGSVDEECGVCLEEIPALEISPCKHSICGPCALKICTADIKKPSLCPFCRSLICGFTRTPPREG